MSWPIISIIIPTLNSGKTLSECLDSLILQTYKNFEVIIVDGASSDDTMLILEYYAKLSASIRWVSDKDNGIYDAMNKGLKLAKGDWIYFLGSDDKLFSPAVLYTIAKKSKNENEFDIIYGDVFSTRFNGIYAGEFNSEKILHQNICHQAIFFKKTVFKKIGNFSLKYTLYADWDHNIRWFLSKRIKKKYINMVIANYADGGFSSNPNNKDTIFFDDRRWKFIKYNKKSTSFINKLKVIKAEFKNALNENRKRHALQILFESPYLFF
ncbi:MAG: glycosyltransferase [Sphingobacteriales bacterium]|nr:glycosyltransferase [Sphingobacteriales bacterium]